MTDSLRLVTHHKPQPPMSGKARAGLFILTFTALVLWIIVAHKFGWL